MLATFLVAFAGLFVGLSVVAGFREIGGSWAVLNLVLVLGASGVLAALIDVGRSPMSRGRMLTLALASAATLGLGVYAFFGNTGNRQARWMAESREVLPTVESRFASDRRFAGLTASVSTSCSVVVRGFVDSEEDELDVLAIMKGITFPHGVMYLVDVK